MEHKLDGLSIRINEEKECFELEVDGHIAFTEYKITKQNIIFLTHSEVPKVLEGKGVGSALALKTLQWIKEKGYPLAPLCPFVAAYIKRHPEWKEILAPGYNV
ncbi:GNAT family N-acetyltransferase [Flavobacterium limnosediminis]|uniref:GNAT family N-acetyltransferase n=1 Tax=Flavobacterium limnosediminis TaxID=1401027 RepID=UPI000686DEBD|nr:GNAT family N-acetyltransferase [Flavobacterium limnosediminis]